MARKSGVEYFVDLLGGNDAGTGAFNDPWQTKAKVEAFTLFGPGDKVRFKSGDVIPGVGFIVPYGSTDPDRPIQYTRYGDLDNPVFDPTIEYNDFTLHTGAVWKRTHAGKDVKQVWEDGERMIFADTATGLAAGAFAYVSGVVYVRCSDDGNPNTGHSIKYDTSDINATIKLNGKSNLIFDGIDVLRSNSVGYNTDEAGSVNVIIKNGVVSWTGGRSIVLGTNTDGATKACSDLTIDHMTTHDDLDTGPWVGKSGPFIVQNCHVYNEGIDCAPAAKNYPITGGQTHYPTGILVQFAANCIVRGNNVHDIAGPAILDESSPSPTGKPTDTLIEKNTVDQSATSHIGIRTQGTRTLVRNNIIRHYLGCGLEVFDEGVDPMLYNNTIISAVGATHSINLVSGTGIVAKNNAVIRLGTTNRFVFIWVAGMATLDRNLYYQAAGTLRWKYENDEVTSLAAWRTASGQDANALNADPVFVTPNTDLHLQVTSPCIGAGEAGLVTDDYDGIARGAAIDIGALEYV